MGKKIILNLGQPSNMPTYYWTDTSQNFYTYGWPDGLNAGVYYNCVGYDVNGVGNDRLFFYNK